MTRYKRKAIPLVAIATMLAAVVARADDAPGEINEASFLDRVRPLTYQGARAGEGYFSPDGRHLIFQSERDPENPFYQIYILSFDTGETHRVSPGVGKTTCSFFRPGSDEVIFASTHMDDDAAKKQKDELDFRASGKERRYSWDYDETFDIYSANRDGSNIERLTDAQGYDAECAYSPDGKLIVFCSTRDAYPASKLSAEERNRLEKDIAYFGEIYIMDADGSNVRRLTDWPGYDGGPFFSPDGSRIIWRHFDESGALADIYTMTIDGSDRKRLTDFGSMCWAPFYHPSGRYVIFTSNKLGFSNFELYIVDAEGTTEPVRVTFTDGFDGLPAFSPDGGRLAWTSNRTSSKKSQLFLADWNHDAALAALHAAPRRDIATASLAMLLEEDVQFLAADEREGRMTGSKGASVAGAFLADRLKEAGVQPLGDDGSYFQEFPFTSGVETIPDECALQLTMPDGEAMSFSLDKDFGPLSFTASDEVEGGVVFAGYGLTTPETIEDAYDSYAGLDVQDKIVVALRYVPEDVTPERRAELNLYSGSRFKALIAREAGAKALLIVTGPNSPNAGELMPLKADQSHSSSGIIVASISGDVADALLAGSGKTLAELQTGLDTENPHFDGTLQIPDVTVRIATGVARTKATGRNVLGIVPAADDRKDGEYIVIGAHYDHIGYGEIGSLAHKGEEGQIHNGADDNASGTAVVLELSTLLAHARAADPSGFARGVIVGFWSGEELGLIGSSYFVEHPPFPLDNMIAYLNFDMVGRLRENELVVQGMGSSPRWVELAEKNNVMAGFSLKIQQDPFLPTDASAFYPKMVPVMSFFTGSHEDYNRPTDDWQTLSYDGMERITHFALAIANDLIAEPTRPQYAKVERRKEKSAQRGALRAYLGTIPDYATEGIEGVKLSGVSAGGPADKAGLLGGDIIIEFGGRKIMDIYDYTYALDAVKIGDPVQVVVIRNEERVTLTVVPESRK